MIEIEAKIKIKGREELISRLPQLQSLAKDHVFDIYFDKEETLKSENKVLRIRKQNQSYSITYKGPMIEDGNLLVREEEETKVTSFESAQAIIKGLGYRPIQIVEKIRELFKLEDSTVKIELDHYPFLGFYLEIEGAREEVLRVMDKLGYSMEDAVAKNCTQLFYEHLSNENLELENPELQFTFESEKRT